MHGIKQAAILAYKNIRKKLEQDGYKPIVGTVGMWQQDTQPKKNCVCVDDFGIKYFNKEDAQHF